MHADKKLLSGLTESNYVLSRPVTANTMTTGMAEAAPKTPPNESMVQAKLLISLTRVWPAIMFGKETHAKAHCPEAVGNQFEHNQQGCLSKKLVGP